MSAAPKEVIDVQRETTQLDRWLAKPMFIVSLVCLACMAAVLYLRDTEFWREFRFVFLYTLVGLYPLFFLEAIWHRINGGNKLRQHWYYCLLPISRLGGRDHVNGRMTWLPIWGWQLADMDLARRLIKLFSVPMILIALLVLPVVIVELAYAETLADRPKLRLTVDTASAFIWSAFVLEFTLVVSVVRYRWRYCRQNWIDLAIILLPLLDFLRIAQLGQVLALKQLTRTARVYRLRGLVIRAWRAILTLKMIDKVIRRNPAVRLERARQMMAEKQEEMDFLQLEINRLELLVAERERKAKEAAKAKQSKSGDQAPGPASPTS